MTNTGRLCGVGMLAIGVVVLAGCGGGNRPKVVSVSGVLTVGGSPVENARVRFVPDPDTNAAGRTAIGDTDASGKFTLSTFEPADGIIPGEYDADIQVNGPAPTAPVTSGDIAAKVATEGPQTGIVPEKFGDAKTSGLRYTFTDEDSGRVVEIKL